MEILSVLDVDDEEIGQIVLDGSEIYFTGATAGFKDVLLGDANGEPVASSDARHWFRLALQLGHPPYLKIMEK